MTKESAVTLVALLILTKVRYDDEEEEGIRTITVICLLATNRCS
jgi:hypothetical protein